MSQLAFDALQRKFIATLIGLVLFSAVFACGQNLFGAPGGEISLPKLLWLLATISLWLVVPIFLANDKRLAKSIRWAGRVFVFNMTARGIVELWMMFVTVNWSPYYGIAHDIFSMGLIAYLLWRSRPGTQLDLVAQRFFAVMFSMFPFEIFFAWYMKTVVQADMGAHVYFVPQVAQYALVLNVTWIAVTGVAVFFTVLTRRWLYG